MECEPEELQFLGPVGIYRESVAILRAHRPLYARIAAAFVLPLSALFLAHIAISHALFSTIDSDDSALESSAPGTASQQRILQRLGADWAALVLFKAAYLLALLLFSLLSTAAAVFTVASLYAAKPASISSSLSALPPILPRLLRTFLWVSLLMLAYHVGFVLTVVLLIVLIGPPVTASTPPPLSLLLALLAVAFLFLAIHVYISALWHLASVISVLEPVCGLAAMSKSRQLLQGRTRTASVLVFSYFAVCGLITALFRSAVVKGQGEEGSLDMSLAGRILIGALLVSVLVCVNLLGLLVQSVFYYACKAYHNQQIDRTALYEHLGGYLGEYVPLKSNIQMENL